MRILHATSDWKWTGPAEPMLNAVVGLRKAGHEADVVCPPAPPGQEGALPERCRERGVKPALLLERRRGYRPWRDREEVRRLRDAIRERDYDVVHVHHTRDQILAWRACRGLRTRLVVGWHRGEPIPGAPWHRLRLGPWACDGLVVLSEPIVRSALRLGWPRGRLCVVPGSVDTQRFRPAQRSSALALELGLEPGCRVIGVVARIQPHRRFDLLLEAFEQARAEAPGLRLLVVGRGTRARQVLEEPVRARGLEPAVVRAGYRREDYPGVLSLFDVLVFLVPGSDGSCRAVLETMAMGIPTVATRRGVLPELVVDGETGRLVDEEPHALAASMLDVWRDPEGWALRGKAARRRAASIYALEAQATRLARFYRELVGLS